MPPDGAQPPLRMAAGADIVRLRCGACEPYRTGRNRQPKTHSALMFAALMIGHHFSISAFCCTASASGVCLSRGHSP